ncbi:MAG: ABC transporter substrate-binding protein [Actinomycetota bacterium]|nr:MAG: ABC transporter substrate-binding protein [Actinomycetota bacterium]
MRLAWRELVRRPGRFIVAGSALTLLVILLLVLGGLLDGLTAASTGAYRSLGADVVVYSAESRASLLRSRIEPEVRRAVEELPGVLTADGIGVALVAGRVPDRAEPVDLAVFGYEAPTRSVPAPPAPGSGFADRSLLEEGVRLGETIEVGPGRVPVRVIGWVEGTRYLAQPGLWVSGPTWREILEAARPDAALPPGVWQGLVVRGTGGAPQLATEIRRTVPGVLALTLEQAISRLPGVEAQRTTFLQIIGVTLAVVGLVVALFFALVVLERVGMLGMLKALGASTRQLATGLVFQAVMVAGGALVVGGLASAGLALFAPAGIPLELRPSRFAATAVAVVAAAAAGSALSFRRVARIDPASAVGGG